MILKKLIATPQVYIEFPIPRELFAESNNGKVTWGYLNDYIHVYSDRIEYHKYLKEFKIETKEVLSTFSNQSFSGLTDCLRELFESVPEFEEALWTQLLLNRHYDPEYEDHGLESLFKEFMNDTRDYSRFWEIIISQNIHALKGPTTYHSTMARELGFFISDLIDNPLASLLENGLSISQMSPESYIGGAPMPEPNTLSSFLKFIIEKKVELNIDSMQSTQYSAHGIDHKWWPTQGIKKIGNFTLIPTSSIRHTFGSLNVEVTSLNISSDEEAKHHLCKIHIQNWEDFEGTSVEDLLDLIKWLDQKQLLDKVTFNNCKAGRGRSSTLFILIELYKQSQKQKLYPLDAIKSIIRVKFTRHFEAVQTTAQLKMIIEAVEKINGRRIYSTY